MGSDFAFMARQKRITIDGIDYWIDLLKLIVSGLQICQFKSLCSI